jgi:hypothetical protein
MPTPSVTEVLVRIVHHDADASPVTLLRSIVTVDAGRVIS